MFLEKNDDGANRIIANYEQCLIPTSRPFWKYIEDIAGGVKTRSQCKKTKACKSSNFRYLFLKKRKRRHKKMVDNSRFRSSYFKRIRSCLCRLMNYLFGLLTIVSNGNIWSDDRDPRIRYRRRHNEI